MDTCYLKNIKILMKVSSSSSDKSGPPSIPLFRGVVECGHTVCLYDTLLYMHHKALHCTLSFSIRLASNLHF